MAKTEQDFSLREKKRARTKIALTNEFMNRLKTTRFADISIKEVCEAVEVSEGTFYNYFPKKVDVLENFFALLNLKIVWEIETHCKDMMYREKIERFFDLMADEIAEPFLFYEILSVKTAEGACHEKNLNLTEAEKVIGFPDCPGIENFEAMRIEEYFEKILVKAKGQGELSGNNSIEDIVRFLIAAMIGVPLTIEAEDFGKLKEIYKRQLAILRDGLDAQEGNKS